MSTMNLVSEPLRERRRFPWKDFLKRHRMFAGFAESELDYLLGADVAVERTWAPSEVIQEEGQPADCVFFVGRGSVKVWLKEEGQPPLELAVLRKGDFFGEMALFEPGARAAAVTAFQECVLLEVKAEALRELTIQHSALELAFLHTLTERLRGANERMLSLKLREVPEALRLLEARLSAEVRVFDASLKAAHAVFEQTRVRSDEVIDNAERTRSRITYVASSIATVITFAGMALGGLGLREVVRLQDLGHQAKTAAESIAQFNKEHPGLKDEMALIHETAKDATLAKMTLVQQQVALLKDALRQGQPYEATEHLQRLADLGWLKDDDHVFDLLFSVEAALVATRDASGVEIPVSPREGEEERKEDWKGRQNFTALLDQMSERATTPATKAKAYSLRLANTILVATPTQPLNDDYKDKLVRFRELLEQNHAEHLISEEDWTLLDERFKDEEPEKRRAFDQVKALIPQERRSK